MDASSIRVGNIAASLLYSEWGAAAAAASALLNSRFEPELDELQPAILLLLAAAVYYLAIMSTRLHAGNTHTLMIWAPLKRSNVPRFLGLSLSTMMVVVVVHNFSISWAVLFGTLCQITDEQIRWGQMQEHQLFDLILCKMRSAADDSWTLSKTTRKISNLAGTKVITCIPKHINWVLRIT